MEVVSAAGQSVRSTTDVIVVYIGQGDVVYYVGLTSIGLDDGSTADMMAVWMHRPLNLVTDWIRCPPQPDARDGCNFQIYQPSFD